MNKVKQAVFSLNGFYFKGAIQYPRVDNSYFQENNNLFPHPDLNDVNYYAEPLSKESYPLDRNTVLLYLGHKGLVNSAGIIPINTFINTSFDENLKPLKADYLCSTVDKFLDFCSKNKISLKDYNHFTYSRYPSKFMYSIRLQPTPATKRSANEKQIQKNNKQYISIKKSRNKDAFLDDTKHITEENDFFVALHKFKLKRKLMQLKEQCC